VDVSPDRALKQIAFRQARRRMFNERLNALDPEGEVPRYRCECGLIACGMVLRMTADEYADLRAGWLQFAVHREHVQPDTDRVVAPHGGWLTVASAANAGRHMDHRGAREQIVDPAPARIEEHR
jgi:hypothetical protein